MYITNQPACFFLLERILWHNFALLARTISGSVIDRVITNRTVSILLPSH